MGVGRGSPMESLTELNYVRKVGFRYLYDFTCRASIEAQISTN